MDQEEAPALKSRVIFHSPADCIPSSSASTVPCICLQAGGNNYFPQHCSVFSFFLIELSLSHGVLWGNHSNLFGGGLQAPEGDSSTSRQYITTESENEQLEKLICYYFTGLSLSRGGPPLTHGTLPLPAPLWLPSQQLCPLHLLSTR